MNGEYKREGAPADWGPRVYLAIDNCFASKRWTRPREWAAIARDLGVTCLEASADNECDPLYSAPEYLADWLAEVQAVRAELGVRVANLYSGHGTYSTLGLAHTDARVRDHILEDWLKPMVDQAATLGAGLGFFCHAFPQAVLQDADAYARARDDLVERLAALARYARDRGAGSLSLEQMYTPHQIPWTIAGATQLMRDVYARGRAPLYLTLDTGHGSLQRRFLRPDSEALARAVREVRAGRRPVGLWLGPASAYDLLRRASGTDAREEAAMVQRIEEEMDRRPYLFAGADDGDPYAWLGRLGCYSPIIHLQQTSGRSSPHWPFTAERNAEGIIQADRVLTAIARAYALAEEEGLPPRCDEIYLTLEVFAGTADIPADIIGWLEESVAYWRQYVPRDGLRLGSLVESLRTSARPA